MFDGDDDGAAVFRFDDIADQLLDQGLEASPSKIHGCFTGMLASGSDALAEAGLDGLDHALELNVHGELADRLMQLYRATDAALRDEEYGFNPLLPDDEDDIETRTIALAGWCSGFLSGVAHVTAQQRKGSWSSESREILEDIAAMAEAEVGDYDDPEEAEESYMEIVEYLRFGVLNLFMEATAIEIGDASLDPSTTLH
jgi:yecA family protein